MDNQTKQNGKPSLLKNLAIYTFGSIGCIVSGLGLLVFVVFMITSFIDGLCQLWAAILSLIPVLFVIGLIWFIRSILRDKK